MAYYVPSVEEIVVKNKCICIFFSFHFPLLLLFFVMYDFAQFKSFMKMLLMKSISTL